MRPFLLLVSGPPASGKTTLARLLAGRLGWPLLGKDSFKEALFDSLGVGDADWSRRLSEAAFARQSEAADRILARGGSLVIEGNFRAAHRPALAALAARHGAVLAQVACRASPATLAARRAARANTADRHAGHLDRIAGAACVDDPYAPLASEPTVLYDGDGPLPDAQALDAMLAALSAPGCDRSRSASCRSPWRAGS